MEDYWLSDGFHRLHAHRNAGLGTIKANVHAGTKRDAVLASVGANAEHGLKRKLTEGEKRVKMPTRTMNGNRSLTGGLLKSEGF